MCGDQEVVDGDDVMVELVEIFCCVSVGCYDDIGGGDVVVGGLQCVCFVMFVMFGDCCVFENCCVMVGGSFSQINNIVVYMYYGVFF